MPNDVQPSLALNALKPTYDPPNADYPEDSVEQALLDGDDDVEGEPPRRPRANTISGFSFDLSRNLLHIPFASENAEPRGEQDLGIVKGIALVVGMQIGSGIFSSPGVIQADVISSGAYVFHWFACAYLVI